MRRRAHATLASLCLLITAAALVLSGCGAFQSPPATPGQTPPQNPGANPLNTPAPAGSPAASPAPGTAAVPATSPVPAAAAPSPSPTPLTQAPLGSPVPSPVLASPSPSPSPAPAASPAPGAAPSPSPAAAAPAGGGETWKIGAVLDITGPAASLGVPERDTLKLLEAQINAQGGWPGPDGRRHPIQVIIYDNQSDETQATLAAKRLIEEDRVPIVLGATQSSTSLAMLNTVQGAQVPMISLAASNRIVEPVAERRWVFKTAQSDSLMVGALVDDLKAKGLTRTAFLSVNNAFGDSGRAEFERLAPPAGFEIAVNDRFAADDRDMTSQLTRVRAANPQALIVWAIPPAAPIVARNYQDLGLRMPIYFSHGIGNRAFIELAGPAADGVIFPAGKLLVAETLPENDPQKAVLLQYAQDYERQFGPRSTFGGHAWDALMLALTAMEKAGTDRAKIRDEIENIKNFPGVSGVFNMSADDHNGLDKRAVVMVRIDNGQWKLAQ